MIEEKFPVFLEDELEFLERKRKKLTGAPCDASSKSKEFSNAILNFMPDPKKYTRTNTLSTALIIKSEILCFKLI